MTSSLVQLKCLQQSFVFYPSMTAWHLLQGDWVWLKKFEEGQFKEVKQSSTKIFTKVERCQLCKRGGMESVCPFYKAAYSELTLFPFLR